MFDVEILFILQLFTIEYYCPYSAIHIKLNLTLYRAYVPWTSQEDREESPWRSQKRSIILLIISFKGSGGPQVVNRMVQEPARTILKFKGSVVQKGKEPPFQGVDIESHELCMIFYIRFQICNATNLNIIVIRQDMQMLRI